VIHVSPSQQIQGEVILGYTALTPGIMYALSESSSWGNPEADTLTIETLAAPVRNGRVTFSVNRSAPVIPGEYWLAWAFGSESAAQWVISGTNWRCAKPVWGDGNDLTRLTPDQWRSLEGGGILASRKLICESDLPREYHDGAVPVATVRVVVR